MQRYKPKKDLLDQLKTYGYNISIRLNKRGNFYTLTDKNAINPFTRKNEKRDRDPYCDINEYFLDLIDYNETWNTDQFLKYNYCRKDRNLFKKKQ